MVTNFFIIASLDVAGKKKQAAMPSFPTRSSAADSGAAEETWERKKGKKRKKNPLACSKGGGERQREMEGLREEVSDWPLTEEEEEEEECADTSLH